jgi:hypothetical protein
VKRSGRSHQTSRTAWYSCEYRREDGSRSETDLGGVPIVHGAAEKRNEVKRSGRITGRADSATIEFMDRLYLFTLEIAPLKVGASYDDLPSHLTLMSRFLSDLMPEELSILVRPLFAEAKPVDLLFGSTTKLGPKKVTVHMVSSPDEQLLHERIQTLLDESDVTFQYPQFVGANHKAHVTHREGVDFPQKTHVLSSAAYLIEVVDGQRIIRSRFNLGKTGW